MRVTVSPVKVSGVSPSPVTARGVGQSEVAAAAVSPSGGLVQMKASAAPLPTTDFPSTDVAASPQEFTFTIAGDGSDPSYFSVSENAFDIATAGGSTYDFVFQAGVTNGGSGFTVLVEITVPSMGSLDNENGGADWIRTTVSMLKTGLANGVELEVDRAGSTTLHDVAVRLAGGTRQAFSIADSGVSHSFLFYVNNANGRLGVIHNGSDLGYFDAGGDFEVLPDESYAYQLNVVDQTTASADVSGSLTTKLGWASGDLVNTPLSGSVDVEGNAL